ncbi:MAG TPA: DUF6801 domain-containing protein [Streptosporangiaceae bacterium]
MGGRTRRSPRRGTKLAAVAIVLAGTGMVTTGATASSGQQVVNLRLNYTCAFPSGSRATAVQVAATFPATATAGRPIQPTGTGITVTLPHAEVAYLEGLKAAAIRMTAALDTKVSASGTSVTAPWNDFVSQVAPLSAKGNLVIAAPGAVPTVTTGAAGDVTFSAGDFSLLLASYRAGGHATSPPSTLVRCTLDGGQNAMIATVPLTATPGSLHPGRITVGTKPGASDTRASTAGTFLCPGIPPNGLSLNPHLPKPPKPPPNLNVITLHNSQPGCAYAVAFSNVRKLGEAGLIGPGLASLSISATLIISSPVSQKNNYAQADNAGELEFHGLHEFPPAKVTLLAFGFMPVTATLQLIQVGTLNAYAVGPASPGLCKKTDPQCQITVTTLYTRVRLHLSDVLVDGVPLDVGSGCQSATPFVIKVTGRTPTYIVQTGGELTGTVTIPPFTGCGVGENLDPVFTASVSGPGNEVLLTQGAPCFQNSATSPCASPPCIPKPQRKVVGPVCITASDRQTAGRQHGD